MHLWTEYEGRTIAEHYTLGKLLRSEGRNGFFATADKDGHPAVIRLTEAHFDEAQQLERWRHVAEVHQDNLIEIEQVGQTTFEGVALTYALMEPEDANLGDVLKERPLTTAETLQVARAVLAALQALHSASLVHEHVEPANVLAVGETVKLRSDCVRECVPDGEFNTVESCADLRRADLHGFATLLLRCLTLETEWVPAHNNLPDPFKRLIPRALDGTWTLEQLAAVLESPAPAFTPARPAHTAPGTGPATNLASPQPLTGDRLAPTESAVPAHSSETVPRPLVPPGVRQASHPIASSPLAGASALPQSGVQLDPVLPLLAAHRRSLPAEPAEAPSRTLWAVLAAVAVLVLWLSWHFFFSGSPSATARPAAIPATPAPIVRQSPAAPGTQARSTQARSTQAKSPESSHPVGPVPPAPAHAAASGWRVIAFTYNHEDQAATKVQRLRRNHNSLHPAVFSPSGHAPYLVSLGGAMSQGEAEALLRHARRVGLPRDTFVRRF